MTCTNCGTENDAGRKFCLECGQPLAATCPNCGTANPPRAKFCGECATPLGTTAGASARAAPARPDSPGANAERRLVSVLFADLVGFTPFAEERDAEEVRETLDRYFELARDVIGRYGGTIEKFIGDAVMAVWGAPIAREDDAERAVRAALDLVASVPVLGNGIQLRAGVLTGEAAVDLRATDQGIVTGDLVNTAARLQSVAPPGTVLVGESTHRAASSAIAFEAAGDQVLKGKAAPVPAWRALRVVANRRGEGRSDLPEPPFVGRDEEMRVLRDLISASARDPRVRVASITGSGGIGKSRLAWELEKYVDGLVDDVYWHRGRSPSYGEGITFWALGEMVRQRAGLAESDDESTTRAAVAAAVEEFVPGADDRRWVEPALLALLGVETPPIGGRDVLFAAWRIFFERIAARGTTVLLFEDLQWADTGLLDFIDHLLEWAKGVPLLIVTLARPELFDRRPTWGAGTRNFTALALEPLNDVAMRELLDGFVPGLPRDAVEAILARADGIPLYAVETVRALVAEGRLRQVEGAYRPVGDLGALAIPETLQSLIGSRLDALDAADRALVQDASVLGQTFSPGALAAVSGLSPVDLEARLRVLVRRELLELRADPRSPERGQYGFVQSLIREVAYATLSRRDRRARHLAVARHFESLGDEELAGALATHYLAAHRASSDGPEAEAVAIQARLALRGAASRAAALGAHEAAVGFLEQALEITAEPAERGDLLLLAAVSADANGTYEAAVNFARGARSELVRAGNLGAAARAHSQLGRSLIDGGRTQEAITALEASLAELPDDADDTVRAQILTTLSRARMRFGDSHGAIRDADAALTIAERLNLDELIAEALNNKGASLSYLGRPREAIALMTGALEAAHAGGFLRAELRARSNTASITWERDPARARELYWESFALARRVGNRGMANWALSYAAIGNLVAASDWRIAVDALREALGDVRSTTDELHLTRSLAMLLLAMGEPIDAHLRRLDEIARDLTDERLLQDVYIVRAGEAFARREYAEAREEFIRAAGHEEARSAFLPMAIRAGLWDGDPGPVEAMAATMDELPDAEQPLNRADRVAARGAVAGLRGRRSDALLAFREAIARYRDLAYDFDAARTTIDALHLLGPDEPELRRLADDARVILERVGATPYLRLLDEALGQTSARSGAASASPTGTVEAAR